MNSFQTIAFIGTKGKKQSKNGVSLNRIDCGDIYNRLIVRLFMKMVHITHISEVFVYLPEMMNLFLYLFILSEK